MNLLSHAATGKKPPSNAMLDHTPSEHSPLLGRSDCSTHDAAHESSTHIALRVGAAMYAFAVMGLFQSTLGVMLLPLSHHYHLSDIHVSLIFIAGPVGYIIAAQLSHLVHRVWGQRGIAILAPALQVLGALAIAAHLPFGIVLAGFTTISLGAGFLDGSMCAWAATVNNANTATGMLQGSFSVGAAVGPFLAGTVLPSWNRSWYDWYYVLGAASAVELCVLLFAFRHENASKYDDEVDAGAASPRDQPSLRAMFKYLALWLISLYFLAYVGMEAAISGWIVPFMLRHRRATPYMSNMASSGFWGGMAAGRFTLGVVTDKLGVGRANTMYFLIAIGSQLVFAFSHVHVVSVALMTLNGFFMGPMFASGIVAMTRLLPAELHVAAVSFGASAGQIGAALLPFGVGALVQGFGIGVFSSATLVLSTLALMAWIPVSRRRPTT